MIRSIHGASLSCARDSTRCGRTKTSCCDLGSRGSGGFPPGSLFLPVMAVIKGKGPKGRRVKGQGKRDRESN